MKWVAVAALASATFAPSGARAGVVAAAPAATAFDLDELMGGVDRVLASVDDEVLGRPEMPFRSLDAASMLGLKPPSPGRTDAIARINAAYAAANVTSPNDPLPEPTTWLMMILGFFGLSFAVRRRGQGPGNRVRFS